MNSSTTIYQKPKNKNNQSPKVLSTIITITTYSKSTCLRIFDNRSTYLLLHIHTTYLRFFGNRSTYLQHIHTQYLHIYDFLEINLHTYYICISTYSRFFEIWSTYSTSTYSRLFRNTFFYCGDWILGKKLFW